MGTTHCVKIVVAATTNSCVEEEEEEEEEEKTIICFQKGCEYRGSDKHTLLLSTT